MNKKSLNKIRRYVYKIKFGEMAFEEDLAKEISRIANLTRELGYKLEKENRNMTKEEAYTQLGHSASLLKAVLAHVQKTS